MIYENRDKTVRVTAEAEDKGSRLDSFLATETGMARNAVQKLIEDGSVTLYGGAVKKNYKVSPGEVFELNPEQWDEEPLRPVDIPLNIIFEDDALVVINKPAGMVVHPAPGHTEDTLVNALLFHFGDNLSSVNGVYRPGIVHRLDKDTPGILLVAKTDKSHLSLSDQFKMRTVSRIYEAVVRGNFREDNGVIDAPIGRHPVDRKRMAVTDKNSRYALTAWEVIARYPSKSGGSSHTHIRCILETGRTHQIRVHMSHVGHPVVGDPVYGGRNGRGEFGLQGQCLYAKRIEFSHPVTGERMAFEVELPESFRRVLTLLGG